MKKKNAEAISGMHMPSGENMWAMPTVGDSIEEEDESEEILIDKEATGLTSIPSEQQNDSQLEQPFHTKDSDNVGVIDVDTVVDLSPMNNLEDSKSENKMENLLEDLVEVLESRGYNQYSSIIKKAQMAGPAGAAAKGIYDYFKQQSIDSPVTRSEIKPDSPEGLELKGKINNMYHQLINSAEKIAKERGYRDTNLSAKLAPIFARWQKMLGTADFVSAGASKGFYKEMNDALTAWKSNEWIAPSAANTWDGMLRALVEFVRLLHVEKRDSAYANQPKAEESGPTQQASTGPAASKYRFSNEKETVKKIQTVLGATPDGFWGAKTDAAWKSYYEKSGYSAPDLSKFNTAEEAYAALTQQKTKPKEEAAVPGETTQEGVAPEEAVTPESTEPAEATEETVRSHIEQFLTDIVSGAARVRGFLGTKNRATLQRIRNLGGVDGATDAILAQGGGWENLSGYGTERGTGEGKNQFSELESSAWNLLRAARKAQRRGRAEDGEVADDLDRSEARKKRLQLLEKVSRRIS